jgi:hypothetical protein
MPRVANGDGEGVPFFDGRLLLSSSSPPLSE